jgi:hypothetical protein
MEFFTNAFSWVAANVETLLQIIGGFAIIATQTPNKSDDKIWDVVYKLVNFAGGNAGKAANRDE